MYFERIVDLELLEWKNSVDRKPLLIRGARQVGKSSAVRNLALEFHYFVEINFDEEPILQTLFENNLTLDEILEQLSIIKKTPIISGKTLVFLDEIQACIPALSSLRYFYEKKTNLHVIAAGSLLEFALTELPSFGVGRVRSLYMYPFSFNEFLLALNEKQLIDLIRISNSMKPMPTILHNKLNNYLRTFFIVGGMPEAVRTYVQDRDMIKVQRVLNDLVLSIQADFTKYSKRVPVDRIQSVFESIVQQLGTKYKFSDHIGNLNSNQIKQVLDLLELAGLIYSVTHSSSNGIPLGAESNPKKRKYLIFDTGIFQRIIGLDLTSLLLATDNDVINKGSIAELFVGLELIKRQSPYEMNQLYYWHRENRNSQAEVDYVIQVNDKIYPIEVKSGKIGKMKSLYLFLNEKKVDLGIRCSLENFNHYNSISTLPLYSISLLDTKMKEFI